MTSTGVYLQNEKWFCFHSTGPDNRRINKPIMAKLLQVDLNFVKGRQCDSFIRSSELNRFSLTDCLKYNTRE